MRTVVPRWRKCRAPAAGIAHLSCAPGLRLFANASFSPSPGTPGEGWGGGLTSDKRSAEKTPTSTLPRSTSGGGRNSPVAAVRRVACILAFVLAPTAAHAATPELAIVLPRGAQRGTEVDLSLRGQRLGDATQVLFYDPSITCTHLQIVSPTEVTAHIRIDPAAPLGEHQLRLCTSSGISELRTFYVGPFPIVLSKKPNNDFAHPQPVDLNVTVAGTIENEEVDYLVVQMKKGQRLAAEVHGMRLGTTDFDPYVAILDAHRFELAVSDDTALARQDSIASILAPADGRYIIQVRESSYGGNGDSKYLLHIGTYPRPLAIYPLGGQIGENLNAQLIGDVAGTIPVTVKLPDSPTPSFDYFAQQDGLCPPSPNFLRASPFPNMLEAEPNDDPKTATVYHGPLPVAFNGIISHKGDIDFFRFTAKGGKAIEMHVIARQLRSPLDSVLAVYNADGNRLADNDDAGGPDSYLRFNPPSDGDYLVSVTDQLRQGGPDYTYRVELEYVEPKLSLTIPVLEQGAASQRRQAIAVPRGNRFATLLRAQRADFGGELTLSSPDLPPGVTLVSENFPGNGDVIPVIFQAAPDAPTGGHLCTLTGRCTDPGNPVTGHFTQNVDLVYGPNNSPLYVSHTDRLAVTVTQEAPFKLRIEQPKTPLLQNGSMNLRVIADRAPGFKNPISVHMLFNPPGVSSSPSVDMPGDQNEVNYPLSANDGAETKHWKVCVLGQSDVGGELWVASDFVDLEVAPSILAMRLEMTAVERGKTAQVYCNVDQRNKFDGTATVKLMGLPQECTAADVPLTSSDQHIVFNLNTTDKSPVGQQSTLFCQVTFTQNGLPVLQGAGQGGVLRIDPPPAPRPNAPQVAVAAPPQRPAATVAGKPMSRLEKLRLEKEQQ